MTKGLRLAEPPRRRAVPAPVEMPTPVPVREGRAPAPPAGGLDQVAGTAKVQFNKRVRREVADGYEILAIRTRRRVPELLAEALDLLEARYGKG